ncbi:Alpha/Beta hydrolase fold [Cinara cedri]|uniref:Alpha/Beta hydrolase fold n=1 Tax=Cinara cedri TaxID=506608 RepID=A0A5E4MUY9_9HEMI|nr:Alpha/Beta hydrolase fold [Cinara cedri]
MDSDVDSELKSDFTDYLDHISQKKKFQRNTTYAEHSYSSFEFQQDNLCSTIKTLFIHRHTQNENVTDDVDVETVENDVKLLTFRPSVNAKSMELYRNSKVPRDPETWEDNINKLRWNKLERTLFDRAMAILYSNRLSRLTFEGTAQDDVQKIISTDKSVAEMHHLLTNYTLWDIPMSQWLHTLFLTYLPDDYLTSYIDILEKLKMIAPSLINEMVTGSTIGRSKEEIKCKLIKLDEPVDPFNYMLTAYPPLKLPKNPLIILIPDFPGYFTQANTRTHDWMNALSYLAELDVALTAKVPWNYEEYACEEELDIVTNLDAMVDATRSKIVSVRSTDPNRIIILAGVGVSAAIACQVAVLEKVDGLVCIGFIVNSSEVKRGYEGDCILTLECPTVFVTGQLSIFSPVLDLEELRVKLKCKTSHILVGGANDELVMNHSTKMKEAVTQKLVDRCVLQEIGNFLKETLEPSPKVTRKPDVDKKTDFKKPVFAKKKPYNRLLARLNKGRQKSSVNSQISKKQMANRKTINIPCTSLLTPTTDMAKDEELMPPPSNACKQDYVMQCENSQSTVNTSEFEELCIPKLGNQKFSTLSDLLHDQENLKINVSKASSSLTSMDDSLLFTSDQKNIVVCSSNFQSGDSQIPVLGEITADQILDMPIVFADTLQEDLKQTVDNSSYFVTSTNEQQMMVNEELVDDDDLDIDIMCPMSKNAVPERVNIKQVAYDSPSKVKLVVNKAPTSLVSSGYQTFSVPSQNIGNIQFVNRLPMQSKIRRLEGVTPKTVSMRHLQDSNFTVVNTSGQQMQQLNKMKTMATTQKFKKIV